MLESEPTATQKSEKRRLWFYGVVRATDWEGRPVAQATGRISIQTRLSGERVLKVENGRFSFEVDRGDNTLRINHLAVGQRLARPEREEYRLIDGEEVVVDAVFDRPVTLHVVDEVTGAHLRKVTLLSSVKWPMGVYDHRPARMRPLVNGAESPIALRVQSDGRHTRWNERYQVQSSGYADGAVDVDFAVGGDFKVALRRGADLRLRVVCSSGSLESRLQESGSKLWLQVHELDGVQSRRVGTDADQGHRVIDTSSAENPLLEVEIGSELEVSASGLAPGRRKLYVLMGDPGGPWLPVGEEPRLPLGEEIVDLVSGEVTSCSVIITGPVYYSEVPLGGVVRVPLGWEVEKLHIDFYAVHPEFLLDPSDKVIRVHDLEPDPHDREIFPFKLEAVSPGLYYCAFMEGHFRTVIDTGTSGRNDVEINVEEPATVHVCLRDALTGSFLEESIPLSAGHCRDLYVGRDISFGGGTPRTWVFRCPVGEILLYSSSNDYEPLVPDGFRVDPGFNSRTYHLRRRTVATFEILLEDERERAPEEVLRSLWMENEEICAQVRPTIDYRGARFFLPEGGWWRLRIDPSSGFEVVEPALRIYPGERIERTLHLRHLQ